jgi:anti-sigma factor RsiW
MNCDQFTERMHRCLDNRMSLEGDGELFRHAQGCDACQAQLDAWRRIASIMPCDQGGMSCEQVGCRPVSHRRSSTAKVLAAMVGLAAAMLFVLAAVRDHSGSSKPSAAESVAADPGRTAIAQTSGELDPTAWWQSVHERHWVEQTMPAVRSVQKGVAPLGRSLLRAVTILTTGARDQTS